MEKWSANDSTRNSKKGKRNGDRQREREREKREREKERKREGLTASQKRTLVVLGNDSTAGHNVVELLLGNILHRTSAMNK